MLGASQAGSDERRRPARRGPESWPARIASGEPSLDAALVDPILLKHYVDDALSRDGWTLSPAPEPGYEQPSLDEPGFAEAES